MDSEQLIAMRKGWRRLTFVEPPMFLICCAYGMTGNYYQRAYQNKKKKVNVNNNYFFFF